MPVAIAPVNRKFDPRCIQFIPQRSDESAILIVDRAFATEMIVMFGDFEQPLTRDIAAASYVL